MPLSWLFDAFRFHFQPHLKLLQQTEIHSFSVDQTRLIFSWSHECSCSRTDHPLYQYTCRYTGHVPIAQSTHYLWLQGTLAGFLPGIQCAPSADVYAVIFMGINIIMFWGDLSFHLLVYWLTLFHWHLMTKLVIPFKVNLSTTLQLQYTADGYAPRYVFTHLVQ